jgi:ATP-dependent protease HslVU (ClpYQ) peptidase subunit
MTTIVGLKCDDGVIIGADSAFSDPWTVMVRSDSKISRLQVPIGSATNKRHAELVIACCGSARELQIVRYMKPPRHKNKVDDYEYLVTIFIPALRTELELAESSYILTYHGKLFVLDADFQVGEPNDRYFADGSGGFHANGALYALDHIDGNVEPWIKVLVALRAASELTPYVRPPFRVVVVDREGIVVEDTVYPD